MPLSDPQKIIADSGARFRVAAAGRRFGKTHIAVRELARAARLPSRVCWYVAPSYRMCRQIVWDKLKAKMISLNWVSKINESDLRIELRNGSIIALRGADNFDSLRGVGLDCLVMDETADIDERAFTEVLRPTLADREGRALFLGTPKGRNWFFDLYQRGQDPTEHSWESWSWTTADGGQVSEEEIESAKRDLDSRTFEQEFLASFVTHSGVIYYNFDRTSNIKEFTDQIPNDIYVGLDFNISPISAVVAARHGDTLHVFDEISIYGSNTDELIEEMRIRYPRQRIIVMPDPSGVARKTSAGGRTDITILENAGWTVKYRRSHPPVRDRINAVNSLLKNADDQVRLWIDPRCRKLIECLEKQTYKDGTQIPDKDSGFDHMNDALGYLGEYLFPIRKDQEEFEPLPWKMGTRAKKTF